MLWNPFLPALEIWGVWRGQCRGRCLPEQLGQALFLRKQSCSGSSPPFVVLPTRWSVEASVVTAPVCNRLVFHGPVLGLLAGLPAALTRMAAEESQWKKGKARSRRCPQAGCMHCSPAAVGWLEELPWRLHISLLILLSMHTRVRGPVPHRVVLTGASVNVCCCGSYHRTESSGQNLNGYRFSDPTLQLLCNLTSFFLY